jgi:hypothetical protein
MTDPQRQTDRDKLEAYLDGALPDAVRAEVVREIEANRDLRAEVNLQKRIDDSLNRQFKPAAPPDDLAMRLRQAAAAQVAEPLAATVPLRARRLPMIAAAAAAVLVWAGLGWYFLGPERRWPEDAPPPPLTLAQTYDVAVATGFRPAWVCKDDHEFASTFKQRHGQGLLLAAMPEGSGMYGLAYSGRAVGSATTMLAHAGESPVMVFVDRVRDDPHLEQPDPDTGLHLFRKELGSLVLYELTPLDEPRVMDYLYAADVPPPTSLSP